MLFHEWERILWICKRVKLNCLDKIVLTSVHSGYTRWTSGEACNSCRTTRIAFWYARDIRPARTTWATGKARYHRWTSYYWSSTRYWWTDPYGTRITGSYTRCGAHWSADWKTSWRIEARWTRHIWR